MPIPLVTRILIADDFAIVREGLKKVLDAKPDLEVVAEAEDGREAVDKALNEDVHLVILDVSMPRMTGIQAAAELHKRKPELKTLILSMHESEQLIREAIAAGARAYVLKSDAGQHLIQAVEALSRHKPFFTSKASETLLESFLKSWPEESTASVLTDREREILQLLAEGKVNKEVASALGISVKTVETHRSAIMRKLGVNSIVELVHYAIRNNLVKP